MLKIKKTLKIVLTNKIFEDKPYFLALKSARINTDLNSNLIYINKSSFQSYKKKYLVGTKDIIYPLTLNSFNKFDDLYHFYMSNKSNLFSSILIQMDKYYILNKFNQIYLLNAKKIQAKLCIIFLNIIKLLKLIIKMSYY